MLSKQTVAKNLKKWGYTSYTESINSSIDSTLQNYVQRQARKVQRGGKIAMPSEYFGMESGSYSMNAPSGSSLNVVTDEFVRPPLGMSDPSGALKGGRIAMPSEYFGVNSGRYAANASTGSSLAVTDQFIRAPLDTSDPTGAITGGGRVFQVSKKSVDDAVAASGAKLSVKEKAALKRNYEEKMTELMGSIARKEKVNHMTASGFDRALNMSKYASLRS